MKIAISGSSGKVCGAIVVQALLDGHAVVGMDVVEPAAALLRSIDETGAAARFSFSRINMQRYDQVLEAFRGCDALIHGAAVGTSAEVPDAVTHDQNVTASYNALRAAIEAGITRITQISSINAIGAYFTPYRREFHYLPLDEAHPFEPADPYSLSKMICEMQADSLVRAFPSVRIATIRPHGCLSRPHRRTAAELESEEPRDHFSRGNINDLWGWTAMDAVVRACLLGLTSEGWSGSEAFYIVAPGTLIDAMQVEVGEGMSSPELARKYHPKAALREGYFSGKGAKGRGFFDTGKAERMLGWKHDI